MIKYRIFQWHALEQHGRFSIDPYDSEKAIECDTVVEAVLRAKQICKHSWRIIPVDSELPKYYHLTNEQLLLGVRNESILSAEEVDGHLCVVEKDGTFRRIKLT